MPFELQDLDYDALYVVPLGGQSEVGLVSWLFIHQGKLLIVDAGASYPAHKLPGVDLLLPSTAFLETNQENILALAMTNGHEEHSGAVAYICQHVKLPRILAPRFVSALIGQGAYDLYQSNGENIPPVEAVSSKTEYKVGPFTLEWIDCNNSVADASALRISCQAGTVLYTSSFKIDQTPIDGKMLDIARFASIGDSGVMLFISSSANVEEEGYSKSERLVAGRLTKLASESEGRLVVVMPATNTDRLKVLFDVARLSGRKVFLQGDTLHKVAVSAAITGHLQYDRALEGKLSELANEPDKNVLVIASSTEADPMYVFEALARDTHTAISLKAGDTLIFSSDIVPGQARRMAHILDELLAKNIPCCWGSRQLVHASRYGAKEELKLMLSIAKPRYFAPAIGEARHITKHAELAPYFNLAEEQIFKLGNGEVLELKNGIASPCGKIESQSVLFNRDQGERVTTASVNERRALSLEGVLTIGLTVSKELALVSGPTLDYGAAGFLLSDDWEKLKDEIVLVAAEVAERIRQERHRDQRDSLPYLRSAVRESTVKLLRSRLSAKPTVQVLVHQLN